MKARSIDRIRRFAAALLLFSCSTGLPAKGARETPAAAPLRNLTLQTGPEAPRKAQYSVSATVGMGATILTIGWKSFSVRWAVVRDDDGILGGAAGADVVDALETDAPEYPLQPGSAVLPIGEATVAFGRIRDIGEDPLHRAAGGTCRIPIGAYGVDRHIRVLLINADGGWERIRFTTRLEFFPGEAALFATRADLPYHRKALAFLDSFFPAGGEEQAAFRRAAVRRLSRRYPDLEGDDPFWDAFRDMQDPGDCRGAFRTVFLRHMDPVRTELSDGSGNTALSRPYWDPLRWDMLYGDGGSPYVTAYLAFLFDIGKPVLSKVLDAELKRADPVSSYDWRQYAPIPAEDGKALARAALRYLHWGVEYTLASDRGGTDPAPSDAVYAENLDALILDWVFVGNEALEWTSNYLPLGAVPVPVAPAAGEAGVLERAVAAGDPLMLTSPFTGGKGNPIPYAEGGIDSPRTFAYKMREQARVREWYRRNSPWADNLPDSVLTTAAPEGFPGDEYVDERRLLMRLGRNVGMYWEGWCYAAYQPLPLPRAGDGAAQGPYGTPTDVLKPFIPGTGAMGASRFTANEAPGPYNSDKTAGADSLGLLSGSIAMTPLLTAVLGTDDRMPALELDRYYAMQPGSPGLDGSGFPSFYADPWPGASCSRGGYRLRRDDLERGTILLPDVASIRLGDLLIRDGEKDGVQVGIVVGFLPEDDLDSMGRVIVLSTDRRHGRAYLSRWDGGSFTTEPKDFQARRLLRLTGSSSAVYRSDPWELVDSSHSGLLVQLTFHGDRWIPNTVDRLVFDRIGLKRVNAWGVAEAIDSAAKPMVAVLGPVDYAFRVEQTAGGSNLYTNKGGDIGFWALPLPADKGKQPVLLATFHRDDSAAEYRSTPNPDLFHPDWRWRTGVELTIGSDSLVFCGGGLPRTTSFGLRVADMQTARPGDDILLRFALVEKRGASGPYETTLVGTAPEADLAAVYDAPMLWRANLYVDEGIQKDWNDKHPWKDAVNNAWYVSAADGAHVDGGQIDIRAWTHFIGNNVMVNNSVAYSLGGTDSVADFNADMMEQWTSIQTYYSGANPLWQTRENPHPLWASWTRTSAPSNDWMNYLLPYGATAGTLNPLTVGGSTLYPYKPGYAMKRRLENPSRYRWEDVNYSAGVDCSGFVDRASSYTGNPYAIQQGNPIPEKREVWSTPGLEHAKHSIFPPNDSATTNIFQDESWLIWEDVPTEDGIYPENIGTVEIPASSIVPGDIVLFFTQDRLCDHVAIINEIHYIGSSSSINRTGIVLIESASGFTNNFRVLNNQNLGQYRSTPRFGKWYFQIRRLKTR